MNIFHASLLRWSSFRGPWRVFPLPNHVLYVENGLMRLSLPYVAFLVALPFGSCNTVKELNLDESLSQEQTVGKVLAGEKYSIGEDDIPRIRTLMQDARDDYRLAGLMLALESGDEALYPDIVQAALDGNSRIAELALGKIRSTWTEFYPLVMNLLRDFNSSLRSSGLTLLTKLGGEDKIPIIIDFFADVDDEVRNQASLSIRRIANRENALLRGALSSGNELVAATAYRTLGYFANIDDTETLIDGFSSESARIRREAQLAVLRLGEDALPALHATAGDSRMAYRVRLSALDVIGGLRSTGSLSFLMGLLDDADDRIVAKAQTILGTYGSEAVPALARLYENSAEKNRGYALLLMGEIGASSALPFLAAALGDQSESVRQVALESLGLYGREAWPFVRDRVLGGDSIAVDTALDYLMNQSDPWLVDGDNGKANTDALYSMLTRKSRAEIELFLKSGDIARLKEETILSLKDVWNVGPSFTELELLSEQDIDKYLYNWRQRELSLAASRQILEDSFNALHDYSDSGEQSDLLRSKELRDKSRSLENEARAYERVIEGMTEEERTVGEKRQGRYEEYRDFLVRTWEFAVPQMRALAVRVYEGRGLDAEALAREASLLDFGSDGD